MSEEIYSAGESVSLKTLTIWVMYVIIMSVAMYAVWDDPCGPVITIGGEAIL